MSDPKRVQFRTIDGQTLHACLFEADTTSRSPIIVMSPGMNFPATDLYFDIAKSFQSTGNTALVYDCRGTGDSDGPRNATGPAQLTRDYHDAVTYARSLPRVDARRVALWGYSLSGACALAAAALDRRVRAVIAVSPGVPVSAAEAPSLITRALRDRESQARGNAPCHVPFIGGPGAGALYDFASFAGHEHLDVETAINSLERIPNWSNEVPLSVIYDMAVWALAPPSLGMLAPRPSMMLVAEKEELAVIREAQENVRPVIDRVCVIEGKGHMNVLLNIADQFAGTMKLQTDFLLEHLGEEV
jgi:hypothetical protein